MSKPNPIGRRLAQERERAKLTQAQLAHRLSTEERVYDAQRISNIENGRAVPSIEEATALANAIGIRPEWLTHGVGARVGAK